MTEDGSHNPGGMWRAWLPGIVLIVIALAQVTLAKTAELSPWKGGGFGMFASTDVTASRTVRVYIKRVDSWEPLEIAPSHTVHATQAKLFPSNAMLTRLVLAVVSREQSYSRPVNAVTVEVWRTEFGIGSLEAKDRLVRTFMYRVDQSAD